jgi:hypothetical protein
MSLSLATYEVIIKVQKAGFSQNMKTMVQAANAYEAKSLAEQQYGKGNVIGTPRLIRKPS